MVKSCVGALRRADGHRGEVEVRNGVGGDGGDHGGGLPVPVGLADQHCCPQEAKAHHKNPEKFTRFGLRQNKYNPGFGFLINFTLDVDMYTRP